MAVLRTIKADEKREARGEATALFIETLTVLSRDVAIMLNKTRRKVVSGVRKVVSGVNKVVSGVNKVVCGVNKVVFGVRKVVCGVNKVVCGVNKVVCGVNKVVCDVCKVVCDVCKVVCDVCKVVSGVRKVENVVSKLVFGVCKVENVVSESENGIYKCRLSHSRWYNDEKPAIFARNTKKVNVFAVLALISMLFASSTAVHAQTAPPEYKLKAVYLFNFLQYVDFPSEVFADDKSPIIIGVLGSDPFGKTLDDTVAGETVKGRAIEVHRFVNVKEIKNCHVLFVSNSESGRLKSILAALRGRSILTVSDLEDFALKGGMFRFVTVENKIRFRINMEAVKEGNITVSAKLLQLAQIVSTEKRP
jgi:hypothetical protein